MLSNVKKVLVSISLVLLAAAILPGLVLGINGNDNNDIKIPSIAKEVRPGVFYLGKAFHDNKFVEGYAFIRYEKGFARPQPVCGNGICEFKEETTCPEDCEVIEDPVFDVEADPYTVGDINCYTYMGARWYTIEPYMINTKNREGIDAEIMKGAVAYAISEWEDAASGAMDDSSINIIGDLIGGKVNGADLGFPDGKNEILFGNVNEPGAIAITIVWATSFDGNGQIVEWDQVYDQVDYDWSISGEAGKMDFLNILTHELGHSFGMGDLYTTQCNLETMYGYAGYGEINKRTLAQGDIYGISSLY